MSLLKYVHNSQHLLFHVQRMHIHCIPSWSYYTRVLCISVIIFQKKILGKPIYCSFVFLVLFSCYNTIFSSYCLNVIRHAWHTYDEKFLVVNFCIRHNDKWTICFCLVLSFVINLLKFLCGWVCKCKVCVCVCIWYYPPNTAARDHHMNIFFFFWEDKIFGI